MVGTVYYHFLHCNTLQSETCSGFIYFIKSQTLWFIKHTEPYREFNFILVNHAALVHAVNIHLWRYPP